MQLTVSQPDLSNALNIVSKAVANRITRSFTPALEGILLEAQNNMLTLTATDMELTITTQIEANIHQEGKTVVPADLLTKLVKTMTDNIAITMLDNGQVELKSSNAVIALSTLDAEEYPQIEDITDKAAKITIPCDTLKQIIQQVLYAISKDNTRPVLCGALFEIKDGYLTMVGLDGYRMAVSKIPIGDYGIKTVAIIPGKALKVLTQTLTDDNVDIYISDAQAYFIAGNTTIATTLIAGNYVNYTQIIPTTNKTAICTQTQQFKHAIERALIATNKTLENNLIKLQIEDNKLILTANSDICRSEETIPIQQEGEALRIAFNGKYLLEALNAIKDTNIKIWFNGVTNPCVIWPTEGEEYCHLILPVRVYDV